jgi:chromosome segregation ATPase
MKTESITYDLVAARINEMNLSGEKVTVRNVLARTGGSAAKIANFIKKWQNERLVQASSTISEELLLSIIRERDMAVKQATEIHNQRIINLESLGRELEEIIVEKDSQLEESAQAKQQLLAIQERVTILEHDLATAREQKDQSLTEVAALKTQLDNANTQLERATLENNELHAKLATVTQKLYQTEQHATTWRAKAEQLQQQVDSLL